MKQSLLTIALLITTLLYAQEEPIDLNGQILDGDTEKPLSGGHVINLNTVVGSTTGREGNFNIAVAANDTIMVSYIGYQTIKLKITNDLLKGHELSIMLHEKSEEMEEIEIRSHNLIGVLEIDIKQVPKDTYKRIKIDGLPQTYEVGSKVARNKSTSPILQPVDYLYSMFGKQPKQLKKIKALKEKQEMRVILSNKRDRELMMEYLQMNEAQLYELLKGCNYSEYFIQTASDLQMIESLLECYGNYKAVKSGSIARELN